MSGTARVLLRGIRAAIIDLDGTMVHTTPDFTVAINRMREDIALPPLSIETITEFVGKGSEHLMRSVLGVDFNGDDVEKRFADALASYQKHYLAINGDYSHVYHGVEEGLSALRSKGLKLACVTNKPIAFARPLLEKKRPVAVFRYCLWRRLFAKKKTGSATYANGLQGFQTEPA